MKMWIASFVFVFVIVMVAAIFGAAFYRHGSWSLYHKIVCVKGRAGCVVSLGWPYDLRVTINTAATAEEIAERWPDAERAGWKKEEWLALNHRSWISDWRWNVTRENAAEGRS